MNVDALFAKGDFFYAASFRNPTDHPVQNDSVQNRVMELEKQLATVCNSHLSLSKEVLISICKLDPSMFICDHYRWVRVFKRVQVAFFEDGLEAIISVRKIKKSNKAAWEAFRIHLPTDAKVLPCVQQVFRSTQKYSNEAKEETTLRIHCNSLRNFPTLFAHGIYLGRKQGRECEKMMMIEKYYSETLTQHLIKNPSIFQSESQIVSMLCSLLESLDDLHKTHVHGDVKSDNLLVAKEKLLLTDVGISERLDSEIKYTEVTDYMSPEIYDETLYDEGWFRMTPAYDIWGFAVIAYRLLHRVIGMEEVLPFSSLQKRLSALFFDKKHWLYESEYARFTSSVTRFNERLNDNPHLLAKWLAEMLKLKPSERLTASDALASLRQFTFRDGEKLKIKNGI